MSKPKDWVHIANTQIRIEQILRDIYQIDVPEGAGNWRTNCPLGAEHSDGGRAKALRVYSDSNTARCFSHNKTFTPVSLWKEGNSGLRWNRKAAIDLLNFYGISTDPPTLDQRWENTTKEEKVDEDYGLREAIIFFAQHQLPNYMVLQYKPEVLELMNDILSAAEELETDSSYGTLDEGLTKAKSILKSYWRENGWN